MLLLKKAQSSDIRRYSPIAAALHKIDECTEAVTWRKFDIAYTMAKEGIAFNKMKTLCELEERHRVNLGDGWKNDLACSLFVAYIAQV